MIAILELLMDAATTYQAKLQSKLQDKKDKGLDGREDRILNWLFTQYKDESKKRWYDPCHILFSTDFAVELVDQEKLNRLIVTGIMLHDIGYFAITDKSQWSTPYSRITHMQEGTALAARVLSEHGFTPKEIEKVVGMISVHDNPYIDIPIQGEDRLGLRDCDRVWVMHMLSFYKDLTSKPERLADPKEFLHDRMTQFYGWEHPFGDKWKVTIDRVKRNAKRIEIPTYDPTKEYVKKQFEQRIQELENDTLLTNSDEFEAYLSSQLDKE